MNTINAYLKLLENAFTITNKMWIEEINSNGSKFDFDCQDIYKAKCDNIVEYNFIEKYTDNSEENHRKEYTEDLIKILKDTILIYEENEFFFNELDRNKLILDEYRSKYELNLSDFELNIKLIKFIEPQQRESYLRSDFYKSIGFLNFNYHQFIYHYSLKLLADLKSNFKSFKVFEKDYLKVQTINYFSMELIGHIHKNYINIIFENVSEIEFYKFLNIQNTVVSLKIKDDQLNNFYYLIHKFYQIIEDYNWLVFILGELSIPVKKYKSKYREIVSKNASEEAKKMSIIIDNSFKKFQI